MNARDKLWWRVVSPLMIALGLFFAAIPLGADVSTVGTAAIVTFAALLVTVGVWGLVTFAVTPGESAVRRRVQLLNGTDGPQVRVFLRRAGRVCAVVILALVVAFAVEGAVAAFAAGRSVLGAVTTVVAAVLGVLLINAVVMLRHRQNVTLSADSVSYDAAAVVAKVAWADVENVGEVSWDQITVGKVFVHKSIEVRLVPQAQSLDLRWRQQIARRRRRPQMRMLIREEQLDQPDRLMTHMAVLKKLSPAERVNFLDRAAVDFLAGTEMNAEYWSAEGAPADGSGGESPRG